MSLSVLTANPKWPADPFLDPGPWGWGLGVSRLALGARIVTWVGTWGFGLRRLLSITINVIISCVSNMSRLAARGARGARMGALGALFAQCHTRVQAICVQARVLFREQLSHQPHERQAFLENKKAALTVLVRKSAQSTKQEHLDM